MKRQNPLSNLFKKKPPRIENLVGHKSLVLGETNSGKTRFTFDFLCYLLEQESFPPNDISILEFAPPRIQTGRTVIGGTLREVMQEYKSFSNEFRKTVNSIHWVEQESAAPNTSTTPRILAPRYSAHSTQEVLKACFANFTATEKQLLYFSHNPTKVIIINDVGIYLHLGGLSLLKNVLALAGTALFNAYYGITFLNDWGSNISRREQIMLELLSRSLNTYLCEHYPI